MNRRHAGRLVTALAAAAAAGLIAVGPAQAQVYPPVIPTATETTVPGVGVGGTKTESPEAAGARPDVAVLGVKVGSLALTGTDAAPYAVGGGVLLLGGAALVAAARRRPRGEHTG